MTFIKYLSEVGLGIAGMPNLYLHCSFLLLLKNIVLELCNKKFLAILSLNSIIT